MILTWWLQVILTLDGVRTNLNDIGAHYQDNKGFDLEYSI